MAIEETGDSKESGGARSNIELVRSRLLELSDPAERDKFDRKLRKWANMLGLPESKRHLLLRAMPRLVEEYIEYVVPLAEKVLENYLDRQTKQSPPD